MATEVVSWELPLLNLEVLITPGHTPVEVTNKKKRKREEEEEEPPSKKGKPESPPS